MNYTEYRKNATKKLDDYITNNMFFAFDKEQFEKGLNEKGLQGQKITHMGMGSFIASEKVVEYLKIEKQVYSNIKKDMLENKELFKNALYYEMANRELIFSYDLHDDIKDMLKSNFNISMDELSNSEIDFIWGVYREYKNDVL